jgi:hypothetical protein
MSRTQLLEVLGLNYLATSGRTRDFIELLAAPV